ncbi:hypothetical protein P7C73_g4570, partial [Tremellales sp. Uapishka_1]
MPFSQLRLVVIHTMQRKVSNLVSYYEERLRASAALPAVEPGPTRILNFPRDEPRILLEGRAEEGDVDAAGVEMKDLPVEMEQGWKIEGSGSQRREDGRMELEQPSPNTANLNDIHVQRSDSDDAALFGHLISESTRQQSSSSSALSPLALPSLNTESYHTSDCESNDHDTAAMIESSVPQVVAAHGHRSSTCSAAVSEAMSFPVNDAAEKNAIRDPFRILPANEPSAVAGSSLGLEQCSVVSGEGEKPSSHYGNADPPHELRSISSGDDKRKSDKKARARALAKRLEKMRNGE